MELKLRWIALAMLMLAAGAAWAVEDGYQVEIGEQGQFVSGQGTGYGQGTWYLYRVTNWWNQWFYNAPYNPDRKKIIEVIQKKFSDIDMKQLNYDLDQNNVK
jgi:hypothetical protein